MKVLGPILKFLKKGITNNNKVYVPLRCRLANQMFEYAMARATALETGGKPVLYQYNPNEKFLLECFELSPELEYTDYLYYSINNKIGYWLKQKLLKEPTNSPERFLQEKKSNWWLALFGLYFCDTGYIRPNSFLMKKKNVHCFGWFQSDLYFKKYKSLIKQELTFKQSIQDNCKELAQEITECDSVCLHIRLGDYLYPEYAVFRVCTKEYYELAIRRIQEERPNAKFYVFTDSPAIFQKEFNFENTTLIPESYTPAESMYLGSLCKSHIMSNSSFSWWMQYLGENPSQIVVAPKKWFNNDQVTEGMYMNHWILL